MGKQATLASLIKALIPFMRALPSRPNHLPEAPPPNTITLGATISTHEFRVIHSAVTPG